MSASNPTTLALPWCSVLCWNRHSHERRPERVGRVGQDPVDPAMRRERVVVGVVHDGRADGDEADDEDGCCAEAQRQRQVRDHQRTSSWSRRGRRSARRWRAGVDGPAAPRRRSASRHATDRRSTTPGPPGSARPRLVPRRTTSVDRLARCSAASGGALKSPSQPTFGSHLAEASPRAGATCTSHSTWWDDPVPDPTVIYFGVTSSAGAPSALAWPDRVWMAAITSSVMSRRRRRWLPV